MTSNQVMHLVPMPRRRRSQRRPRGNGQGISNTAMHVQNIAPRYLRRQRRRRPRIETFVIPQNRGSLVGRRRLTARGKGEQNSTEVILSKCEFVGNVNAGLNIFPFAPGKTNMPYLDTFAGLYGNWRLNACRAEFRSAISQLSNGQIVMGVDYNTATAPTSKTGVSALDGVQEKHVYEAINMPISPAKVNKSRWLSTFQDSVPAYEKTPFSVNFFSDAPETTPPTTLVGSLWINYSVTFMGPDINESTLAALAKPSSTAAVPVLANAPIPAVAQGASAVSSAQPQDDPVIFVQDLVQLSADENTDMSSTTSIDHTVFGDVGDTLTAAVLVPQNLALTNAVPTVNFRYSDGTQIPTGTITALPLSSFSSLAYGDGVSGVMQTSNDLSPIFASLFTLAKPLLKQIPIFGEIICDVFGGSAMTTDLVATPTGSLIVVAEDAAIESVVTSFGQGSSLDVVVPNQLVYNWADMFTGSASLLYQYAESQGQMTSFGPYNIVFYNASNVAVAPTTGVGITSVTYIKVTPQFGTAPFTSGDMWAVYSVGVRSSTAGTAVNLILNDGSFVIAGETTAPTLQTVDGLGSGAQASRITSTINDVQDLVLPLAIPPFVGDDNVCECVITFTRISRANSSPIAPPVSAALRTLHIS